MVMIQWYHRCGSHCLAKIGVASTKAFTSQITVLSLLALLLGRLRVMSKREGQEQIEHLQRLPSRGTGPPSRSPFSFS